MTRRDVPTLCIDALAAYRLARLVTKDVITEDLRDAVVRGTYSNADDEGHPMEVRYAAHARQPKTPSGASWSEYAEHDGGAPKVATLVTCYWCAGMWISFGVIAARRWAPGLWDPLARVLATSAVAALTAGLERD